MIVFIFLLAAFLLFVLDAFGIGGRINLQSAGLACVAAALLAGGAEATAILG